MDPLHKTAPKQHYCGQNSSSIDNEDNTGNECQKKLSNASTCSSTISNLNNSTSHNSYSNNNPSRRISAVSSLIVRKFSTNQRRNGICAKGIPIPINSVFKFVIRTAKPELTISFMLTGMSGYALATNKTEEVFAEKVINDPKFWERSSFHPCVNMWYDGFCAFESVREASRFLVFNEGLFYSKKYNGTEEFKRNASFVFDKQGLIHRRSKSNIIQPELSKLIEKSRKFSLVSLRPTRHQPHITTSITSSSSKLRSSMLHDTVSLHSSYEEQARKKELFSLSFNKCFGCLQLKPFNCETTCNHVKHDCDDDTRCIHNGDGSCEDLVSPTSVGETSCLMSSYYVLP